MVELEFVEDLKKLEKLSDQQQLLPVHISMLIAKWEHSFEQYEIGMQQELFADD